MIPRQGMLRGGVSAAVIAAYFAAITGLWISSGHTARQTASRSPGPAAAGDVRLALEGARGVLGRGQPGVLDQR